MHGVINIPMYVGGRRKILLVTLALYFSYAGTFVYDTYNLPMILPQENVVDGGCKGSKDGVCYFQCEDKHGLFLPIERLDKDDRFQNVDDATDNLSSSPSQNVSNQKDVNSASNVQSTTSPSQSAGFQSGGFLSGLLSRLNLGDSPPSCKQEFLPVIVYFQV